MKISHQTKNIFEAGRSVHTKHISTKYVMQKKNKKKLTIWIILFYKNNFILFELINLSCSVQMGFIKNGSSIKTILNLDVLCIYFIQFCCSSFHCCCCCVRQRAIVCVSRAWLDALYLLFGRFYGFTGLRFLDD